MHKKKCHERHLHYSREKFHVIRRLGRNFVYDDRHLTVGAIPKSISKRNLDRILCDKANLNEVEEGYRGIIAESLTPDDHRSAEDTDKLELYPDVSKLSLIVSNVCNMSCIYCDTDRGKFRQDSLERNTMMREEVAIRAVDYFLKNYCSTKTSPVRISFFGGEPLINWKVIKQTILHSEKKAAEKGVGVNFIISTNGTCFSDDNVQFISDHANINGLVSIDSDRAAVHNMLRPYVSCKGSFKDIEANIKRYPFISNRFAPRMTITRVNTDIFRYAKYFYSKGFKDVFFFPVASSDRKIALRKSDMKKLDAELEKLLRWNLRMTRKTGKVHTFGLSKWYGVMAEGKPRLMCRGGYQFLTVTHDGDIYPCHHVAYEKKYKLGDIRKGVSSKAHRSLLCEYRASNNPRCQSCWAMYLCGGCYYLEDLDSKGIIPSMDLFCMWQKSLFENSVVLYHEMNK